MAYVKENKDHYKGLYTEKAYKKGELIFEFTGEVFDYPTRESIQIGPGLHQFDEKGQFVNHSCFPSTFVKGNKLYAISDLEKDTEITFDYNENEEEMSNPFICNCCGKEIKGKIAVH